MLRHLAFQQPAHASRFTQRPRECLRPVPTTAAVGTGRKHSMGQARVENCDLAAQSPPYRLESFCLLMVSYRSCITAATWLARLNGRSHKGYDESQCRLQSPIQS